MSIETIVDAAVEIADAGGLSSVSMSSVAASLGFTPMSLYRYISAKDDLILLMQERGIGVPPESLLEIEGWREGMRAWAAESLRSFVEHPWLLDIPISGTPITPNNLAWLDAALTALESTPLEYADKISVVLGVMAQTRWEGIVSRGYTDAAASSGTSTDDLDVQSAELLAGLITEAEFPQVRRALEAGVFSPDANDPFSFGLERYLDGIAAYLDGRGSIPVARPDSIPDEVARDTKVREAVKARRETEKLLREARKRERQAVQAAAERMSR